ncbi:MAG: hypothetical protein A2161_07425 [Candidatus Schekmanbacteria bacterium RBG_13_48_7]|uniref:Beta-ketoacyl synthase-like N-terminal domain-containing protein n=1 Tax=Candidatus Schekmanbacteria bacterium RBG_13_48_7 TaxID=1817878 RepID=A0A1F7RTH0_9BACT|nr:MAG: hypothetical protein A2161_07425 [Candidatus Schekmanbacteria bacterium RBG_13_48_7]
MTDRIPIVISGIGSVCSLGICEGRVLNTVQPLSEIDNWPAQKHKFASLVKKFNPSTIVKGLKTRRLDNLSVWTLVASALALKNAGIDHTAVQSVRKAIVFGAGFGCLILSENFLQGISEHGLAQSDPIVFPETLDNFPAAHFAQQFNFQGANITFNAKGISGEAALLFGADLIACAEADLVIVAAGDTLTRSLFDWYEKMNVLSSQANASSGRITPFCFDNDGFIPGEGVCACVLEPAKNLNDRNKNAIATFIGGNISFDPTAGSINWGKKSRVLTELASTVISQYINEPISLIISSVNGSKELNLLEAQTIIDLAVDADVIAPKCLFGEFEGSGLLRLVSALSGSGDRIENNTILDKAQNIHLRHMGNIRESVKTALLLGTSTGGGKAALLFKFT